MKPSHLDAQGRAQMVDVTRKAETERLAETSGRVRMADATREILFRGMAEKGDVLAVARIAGIQAAKRTGDLIPLCHPLPLTDVRVDFHETEDGVGIAAAARTVGRTGVEMEALTAVSVAALTIYDMLKAVDRGMEILDIRLERKSGGKSGTWQRP
ncbi:MAG: cyclic pyranopterin monophosphate synthase MoaC [Thermaerobacter sp.]|nr:cyclic pyranopterin monophosphate synthase MoaC [Thermaerobacter sp.]